MLVSHSSLPRLRRGSSITTLKHAYSERRDDGQFTATAPLRLPLSPLCRAVVLERDPSERSHGERGPGPASATTTVAMSRPAAAAFATIHELYLTLSRCRRSLIVMSVSPWSCSHTASFWWCCAGNQLRKTSRGLHCVGDGR